MAPRAKGDTREPAAERTRAWYIVGEIVEAAGGVVAISLIDRVQANGRAAAAAMVVGDREGRYLVAAEANTEVIVFGPPPEPLPVRLPSQSIDELLREADATPDAPAPLREPPPLRDWQTPPDPPPLRVALPEPEPLPGPLREGEPVEIDLP